MKKEGKTNFETETQQNLMKIIEWLGVDVLRTQTVKEIMDGLGITESKVRWTLHNLAIRGWAEQVADGWRLGPRLPRIAEDVRRGITDTVKRYLGEAL